MEDRDDIARRLRYLRTRDGKEVDFLIVEEHQPNGQVSHNARHEVMRAARRHNIPLYQCHSCGICTLRDCLNCLVVQAPTTN